MAGISVTRNDIDNELGQAFRNLNAIALRLMAIQGDYLAALPLPDLNTGAKDGLTILGYSDTEAAVIRAAMTDAGLLYGLYTGVVPFVAGEGQQPAAQDFRVAWRPLWGLGV